MQLTVINEQLNQFVSKYNIDQMYVSSLKYIEDENYKIVILNLSNLFKNKQFTSTDIIKVILDIEKSGFKFHCQVLHYIYFIKKKSFFSKLFKKS